MAKLISNLTRIAAQAPQAAEAALQQTGEDIASLASQLAPVKTGALRDSIRPENVSEGTVLVGTDKEYAVYVEYGTSESAAQSFLTPAFLQSEATFKVRLKQEIEKIVK